MRPWSGSARRQLQQILGAQWPRAQQSRRTSSSSFRDDEPLFRYTSGRWLWDEQARLNERYRRFDVLALQDIAASSIDARCCTSIEKLAEGGSNRIFRLVMDNNKALIARIPHSSTAASALSLASEVATMDFASTVLSIPVPKVLAWSACADNPVCSEYIIMEEAPGVQLGKVWDDMDIDDKAEIVEQLTSMTIKFQSFSFSQYVPATHVLLFDWSHGSDSENALIRKHSYGNLYFSSDDIPGSRALTATGLLPAEVMSDIEKRYTIGPTVEDSYWNGARAQIPAVRGPWHKASEWLKSIAMRELTWLKSSAKATTPRPFQPSTQGSPTEHISLYDKFLAASEFILPKELELVRSTLWHWDLHAPNIFVTGNKITGIIDWQDCWAGPLMLQVRRPKVVEVPSKMMLHLPDDYKSLPEGPEKERICKMVEKSILLFSYDSDVQKADPVFEKISKIPHLSTIKDLIMFAGCSWETGILPFRECLIRLSTHWNEICPDQPCPFTFTPDELEKHAVESKGFDESADFWASISGLVTRDGYVFTEDYDEAFEFFASLREEGLRMFEGQERDDFEAATTWAARR